jgi:hypothetical protein
MSREEMRDRLRDRVLEFHGRDGSDDSDMALATGLADALVDVVDDEALDRMANTLLEETNLRAMDFRNGMSMEIEPARALAANFVGAARAMLGGAPNYSETPVTMLTSLAADPDQPATWEKFAFIVQRIAPGKLTPHEARMAAEQRAERAEVELGAAKADAKQWHETYQQMVNGTDEFLGDLLKLLPGAEDTGMDAWDQIPHAVKALAAERDITMRQRDRVVMERDDYQGRYRNQMIAARDLVDKLVEAEAERDELKAAAERVRQKVAEEMQQPYAMTNAEMEDLRDLPGDEYHERCGEVFRQYFLRIVRGTR